MIHHDLRFNSGQMLIEVVIAIGIIAMVLVGVTDLLTRSIYTLNFQKQKEEASSIVSKIQNDYRLSRDIDPISFYNSISSRSAYQCVADKDYMCTVSISKTADLTTIVVKSEWISGSNTFNVSTVQSLVRSMK